MDTATDKLIPEVEETLEPKVEQKPEKPDYSKNIDISKIPENERAQIETAKSVISILSLSAENVELHEYIPFWSVELPGKYSFQKPNCDIEFKPGWNKCRVTLGNFVFDMAMPTSREDFDEQRASMIDFIKKYRAAFEEKRVAIWQEFKEKMNSTSSADPQ